MDAENTPHDDALTKDKSKKNVKKVEKTKLAEQKKEQPQKVAEPIKKEQPKKEAKPVKIEQPKKVEVINEKKSKKTLIITLVVVGIVILLTLLFCTIFALVNMGNDKILKNVSIMGIDVQELTQDEAKKKLNKTVENRFETDLVFKHGDKVYTLTPKQIEFGYNFDKAINEAYNIGREGNIFTNNFAIIKQLENKKDIVPEVTLNQDLYNTIEDQINESLPDGVKDPSYEIKGNKLVVTTGKDGKKVVMNELKKFIIDKMLTTDYNNDTIDLPVEDFKAKKINIEEIHKEIYKEAVDASFTKDPFKVNPSQTGIDFSISIDEAKALITGDKETYEIPVKVLYPKVTTDQIGDEAFPNLLGAYSSNYGTSNYNRSTNIALATAKINGKVLMPGETFSYNRTVGQRTVGAGFKEAGAYVNGQVTTAIGGGICQVSSTLYNAVLRANLEVTARTNHMFPVGYVPIGTDATVSWGSPDFKFKNNRNYPVKIVATTGGKNVYIKIFGLKEDSDYEVQIQSYTTGSIPFKTTYTKDASLAPGEEKVVQNGSNGCYSAAYKILKKDGKEVSRTLISRDKYQPHNKVIARGE